MLSDFVRPGKVDWTKVIAVAIYIGVATMWLVPDRRFERPT
jgi:hypothetical protein